MNNNFQNNENMMFFPYNPMMAQQKIQPDNQPNLTPKMDFEIISKNDFPNDKY